MTTTLELAARDSDMPTRPSRGPDTVHVSEFTDGILDPSRPMLGPVRDGGRIVASTAPGCWGPMITPAIRGGHEVTRPVAVEGAEVGDAIAIRIENIRVTSLATASGNDRWMEGRFLGDPYVAGCCSECKAMYPETVIRGIGPTCVRCAKCGADAAPFTFTNGYTICFDGDRELGVTVCRDAAEKIARNAKHYAALPGRSVQNPILAFAPHDLVGVVARLRPFLGQLGTMPSIRLPDSHNAGDFASFLVGAPHEFAITREQLECSTDGHMDINTVREGAIVVCPVKVPGGGVYLGDMHALQGDGEIAGHTCDVAGEVIVAVQLIKKLMLDGPILFPLAEDLPFLARPLDARERSTAIQLAKAWGFEKIEESLPISIVGTGPDLNAATDNGLARAAALLAMSLPEVKNRATITGAIEVGRHPGVVRLTLRSPVDRLEQRGLLTLPQQQYNSF